MRSRLLVAAAAALLVSACNAGPYVVDHVDVDPSYSLQQLASGGVVHTEVIGNPFHAPQPEFAELVASSMRGANAGAPVDFTTSRSVGGPYRVYMIFDGPAASNGLALCGANPPTASGARDGTIRVLAAFCRTDTPLTYLAGHTSGIADMSDPKFRAFVRQIAFQLFPMQNPQGERETDRDRGCLPTKGEC